MHYAKVGYKKWNALCKTGQYDGWLANMEVFKIEENNADPIIIFKVTSHLYRIGYIYVLFLHSNLIKAIIIILPTYI